MNDYLRHLNDRLAQGVARLPSPFRTAHADWILAKQNPDGGWSGREGDSDLYYTGFALRGLSVLDALSPQVADKASQFLASCLSRQTSVVDFFSFLYATLLVQLSGGPDILANSPPDWPERVAAMLETFRTPDAGYNKSPGAKSGSTYHTFLVGLCYQLLGQGFPNPQAVAQYVRSRKREDGGFVEVAPMRRSGTNPTAAGIGILQLTEGTPLSDSDTGPTIEFLLQMPSDEGGLRANDRVPLADLLSTFTGAWSLEMLGALDRLNARAMRSFAETLSRPTGGFPGGLWDEACDVEYTFYGLGTLGLFS